MRSLPDGGFLHFAIQQTVSVTPITPLWADISGVAMAIAFMPMGIPLI